MHSFGIALSTGGVFADKVEKTAGRTDVVDGTVGSSGISRGVAARRAMYTPSL